MKLKKELCISFFISLAAFSSSLFVSKKIDGSITELAYCKAGLISISMPLMFITSNIVINSSLTALSGGLGSGLCGILNIREFEKELDL